VGSVPQDNKKGPNQTLRQIFTFNIDLSDEDDRYIYAADDNTMITLRSPSSYHRSNVISKRRRQYPFPPTAHKVHFGDKPSDGKGWLGLKYGRLTTTYINQLENEVIQRLCKGQRSRNMVCTLVNKPGAPT
jgi:hypothetical protein